MTVSSEINKVTYPCNGTVTDFTFEFKIFSEDDLKVIVTDDAGNETVLTITTDYTVTGENGKFENGGIVSTVKEIAGEMESYAWPDGYKVTIMIDLDLKQETDLVYGGKYSSQDIETMADRLTKMAQQITEKLSRALLLKVTSALSDIELPALTAGKWLYSPDGETLAWVENIAIETIEGSEFVTVTYAADKAGFQDQIDGKIISWFQEADPNTWEEEDRAKHTGDMWYQASTHLLKRYVSTTNDWHLIEDQKAIDAYANAATAQDTADGKRRVFTAEPTTPYDVGDLWAEGPTGDLKKCKVARESGDYVADDWESAFSLQATVTDFAKTFLDDENATAVLTTLGLTTFIKTLMDDTNSSTALKTLLSLLHTSINKTANYSVVTADRGKLINVDATSGNKVISLPSVADTGNGFAIAVKKTDSSGNYVEIAPDGAETIDGESSYFLRLQNYSATIVCDGMGWKVIGYNLVKGAANQKLFMNAAATAPEWASGIKIGTFTRDAAAGSSIQTISGVGFKPNCVEFIANVFNTVGMSTGFDDGTNHYCAYQLISGADLHWGYSSAASIRMDLGSSNLYTGNISALNADGFVVNWLKDGAPTGTIRVYYKAYR